MNFLLDVNNIDITKPIGNMNDKLLYGGQMLLIGLATVFAVLVVLWFTLVLFKLFFHDIPANGKKKTKEVVNTATPVTYSSPAPADEEIVAVIAAAIAMAESESGTGTKFRVVSFRRK